MSMGMEEILQGPTSWVGEGRNDVNILHICEILKTELIIRKYWIIPLEGVIGLNMGYNLSGTEFNELLVLLFRN